MVKPQHTAPEESITTRGEPMLLAWVAIAMFPLGVAGLLAGLHRPVMLVIALVGTLALWICIRRLSCRLHICESGMRQRGWGVNRYIAWTDLQTLRYAILPERHGIYGYRVKLADGRTTISFILPEQDFQQRLRDWRQRCPDAAILDFDAAKFCHLGRLSPGQVRTHAREMLAHKARGTLIQSALLIVFAAASFQRACQTGEYAAWLSGLLATAIFAGMMWNLWTHYARIKSLGHNG